MKKLITVLSCFGIAYGAFAEAGFRYAMFSGERNYSSDVWLSETVVATPSMLYSQGYNNNYMYKTFAYASYMYFEGLTIYRFRASWDDYAAMKIDDKFVVNTDFLGASYGSICFTKSGYHKIELGVSNASGYYGFDPNNGYAFLGVEFSTDDGKTWKRFLNTSEKPSLFLASRPLVEVNSSIRENDTTIIDLTYVVHSEKPTVKVRVLAFEDGMRSFAKVVRPETFVEGTGANVGDNVTPEVEHKISWRVAADWKTKLAKVKVEVLACEDDLLPLELMTIPPSDQYGKMRFSRNEISVSQWFDALLWLYAANDPNIQLSNGSLRDKTSNLELANGSNVMSPAFQYVYGKMGYSLLTGTPLSYVNAETRLGLSPSGTRQYAYKIVEE